MHMWRMKKKTRNYNIKEGGMSLMALQCKLRPVWCQWAIIPPPTAPLLNKMKWAI